MCKNPTMLPLTRVGTTAERKLHFHPKLWRKTLKRKQDGEQKREQQR